MMMCKFEHDGYCCNCGSPQYMCKCKPNICGSVVPITNADRIRGMDDEELAVFLSAVKFRRETPLNVPDFLYIKDAYDWLQQPAEEDT